MKPCGKSGRPGPVGRLLAFCRGGVPLAVLLLFLAPSTSGQCIAPSPFPFARPITQIEEPEFSVGTSLMYECRPGYKKKQFSIMCQANSAWTSAENMCTRKQCDTPKDPQNGIVHIPTDIQFGSSIDYTCNEGFRLIGSSSAMCILSDTTVVWDTEAPTCQQIPCEPPPAIANGEFSSTATEDFRYGMVVTYHCKSDKRGRKLFNLVGTTSLHCTTNDGNTGVWSGPPPQCIELNKCIPPHVENAIMVSENKSLFSLRDFVEFKCQPGFIMDGVNTVHCHNLNKWEPELPTCFKAKSCGAFLDHLPNGRVLFPLRAQLGAKVSFVCNEGFQLKGNSASYCILHGRDSVWNSSVPVCEQVICIIPKKDGIQEGLIRNYYFGNNVTLKCEDGYTLEGSSQSQCQSDASWFPPLAHCVAQVICIIPKKDGIQEGLIRNYYFGNNVTLKCEDGYTLEGSSQSQCQSDANWFPPLAHCVARSNRGLIAGIVFGVLFILFSIISCWLILKYKKRNTTDENCKEVSIHLNSQEDGCSHAPVLLTSQNSRYLCTS